MLQVGDTVMLRSGGPAMTVVEIRTDGCALCVWPGGEQAFPLLALVKGVDQVPPLKVPQSEREYDWNELTTEKGGG